MSDAPWWPQYLWGFGVGFFAGWAIAQYRYLRKLAREFRTVKLEDE